MNQPRKVVVTTRSAFLILIFLVLLTYGAGINGPFMLDDVPNLAQINRWLAGEASWWEAIFGTGSGLLRRPVAHLTFLLDGVLTYLKPGHMKLVNLLVHVASGLVMWRLAMRLIRRDDELASRAEILGLLVAALWLLHPLNVSTVLYIVQRMAQLSAFFSLLAMWSYLKGRETIETGNAKSGVMWIFLSVPVFTMLAALSKENGLLIPIYCGVIELLMFRAVRPKAVLLFLFGFVFAPIAVAVAALVAFPNWLLAGYSQREWGLMERILTQFPVLWDYIGQILLPNPLRMGLYSDDVVASTSLWQPWTTGLGLLGLLALAFVVWRFRYRAPLVSTGIALFFAGHAMESTLLPLELAFEHRNYLPAFGLLLAVVSGVAHAWRALSDRSNVRRLVPWLIALPLVTFTAMTAQRAWVWGDLKRIAAEGVLRHPNSLRAHLEQATILLQTGKFSESEQVMLHLAESSNPKNRAIGFYGVATIQCIDGNKADVGLMDHADENLRTPITLFDMQALDLLLRASSDKHCAGVDLARVLQTLERQLALAVSQPVTDGPVWRVHLLAASYYAQLGELSTAVQHGRQAWQPTADLAAGVFLAELQLRSGLTDAAAQTIEELKLRSGASESAAKAAIERLESSLAEDHEVQADAGQ